MDLCILSGNPFARTPVGPLAKTPEPLGKMSGLLGKTSMPSGKTEESAEGGMSA